MSKGKGSWGWKADIEKRCIRVDMWGKFVGARERYRAEGETTQACWEKAWSDVSDMVAGAEKAQGLGALVEDPQPKTIVLQQNYRERQAAAAATAAEFAKVEIAVRPPEICLKDPLVHESIKFVFNNIDVINIRPDQAPSQGAWSMWRWASKLTNDQRTAFYNTWLPKLSKDFGEKEAAQVTDDGRQQLSVIERLKAKGVTAT